MHLLDKIKTNTGQKTIFFFSLGRKKKHWNPGSEQVKKKKIRFFSFSLSK